MFGTLLIARMLFNYAMYLFILLLDRTKPNGKLRVNTICLLFKFWVDHVIT